MLYNLSSKNVIVNIIDVDSEKYSGLEKSYSSVSKSSLLKFSIPDFLQEIDKALYVDGDILVLKDISKIFEYDISDVYAAVIKDGPKDKIEGGKKHAYYGEPKYFNSGVMYLNLKKMREDKMSHKLIDFRLNEYNYFMDQDAFNQVFNGKVKYLSVLYDFMLHLISYRNTKYSIEQLVDFYELKSYQNIDDLFNDIVILHYTFYKPWKYYDVPFNEIWMEYYKKSPLFNEKLQRESIMTELYNSKGYVFARKISKFIRKIIKN